MIFRSLFLGAMTALLGALILAGCATHRASGVAGRGKGAAYGAPFGSDAEIERRIRTVAHYATGLSYELNDEADLALQEMMRAARIDPSYEPIVIEAARRCIRAEKPEQAVKLLVDATSQPGASGEMFAWLGMAYAHTGKADLAIKANREAIKRQPGFLEAYENLVQLYLQDNRPADALRVLDDAASQKSQDPEFLIDLSELYVRHIRAQGAEAQAIKTRVKELLDRAAALGPSNPLQVLRLAETYFALGELKLSEPFYRQLLDEHPDLPSLRSKLTEIYLRSGQKDKASQQLEALARSEPTNPQTHLFLGALAVEAKDYPAAAEHFERALTLDPSMEQVYYELAGLKLSLEKPQEALALLDQARAKFKLSFPMEFYSGIAHRAAENYPAALNHLISAEAIARATDPSRLNHAFFFQLGATYERAGQLADAEKAFRECLKLAPDDAEALNYLGYMWAEKGIKLKEARELIEKALKIEPDNASFLDSLAWVLFKLGKPSEALATMLKAIEGAEEPDPTLYDHLGDIHAALKQYDQAREAWSKALKIKPDDKMRQKLEAAPAVSHPAP